MADPLITPLIAGAVVAAVTSSTVKWSEIEAWIESKRRGLKTPTGRATVACTKTGKKVIVTVTVYSLVDPLLAIKPKPKRLDSKPWNGDRVDRALVRKFNGKPSFDVPLAKPA